MEAPTRQPFTKLHMIQADYGDSLLLEYLSPNDEEPKFWLTDGGPRGQRYSAGELRASEHLFKTLNTLVPTGSTNAGVPPLERLIVTHPHQDHQTGVDYLIQSLGYANDAKVEIPADGRAPRPDVNLYSWRKGLNHLQSQRKFPWSYLWYNDKAVVNWNVPITPEGKKEDSYKPTADGFWMRDLINSYFNEPTAHTYLNTEFPSLSPDDVVNNRKFTPEGPEYKAVCKDTFLNLQGADKERMQNVLIVRPDVQDLVDFVIETGFKDQTGYNYEGLLRRGQDGTGERLNQNLVEAKTQAAVQKAQKELETWISDHKVETRKIDRWINSTDSTISTLSMDSAKSGNAISIVYEFFNNGTRSLFTGDHVGILFQNTLHGWYPAPYRTYNILKLPHHGSCKNVLAQYPPGTKSTGMNNYMYSVNFFKYFKAYYYCISANPFGQHPNPDLYTISAFVDGYTQWGTNGDEAPVHDSYRTTNLILTNGISYNSYVNFRRQAEAWSEHFTFNLWFTPKDRSWCTIDAVNGPDPETLQKVESTGQYYTYYQQELNDWYNAQSSEYQGSNPNTSLESALAGLARRTETQMSGETRKSIQEEKKNDPNAAAKAAKKELPYNHNKRDQDLAFGKAANTKAAIKRKNSNTSGTLKKQKQKQDTPSGQNNLAKASIQDGPVLRLAQVRVQLSNSDNTAVKDKILSDAIVQTDQGSDFNLISRELVIKMGLTVHMIPLSQTCRLSGRVSMRTIDGTEIHLLEYVNMHLGVSGIWRDIQCFLLPDAKPSQILTTAQKDKVQLLLGIPWLFDVNAIIHIKDSMIQIGDASKGEYVQSINGVPLGLRKKNHNFTISDTANPLSLPLAGRMFTAQALDEGGPSESDTLVPSDDDVTLEDVWHDFSISRFQSADLPDWKYLKRNDTIPTAASTLPSAGEDAWVDLSKFLQLLEQDNSIPTSDGTPMHSVKFLNMLRNWLSSPRLYPNGADAVLGVLLAAFFDPDVAAQFLTALPLNPNGPMDFLGKLETSTTRAAITLLPVHNIRFEVVTPDRAANSRLLVYAMYFELHTGGANMPLPVIGTAMRPADVMTWRVPFANSTYQQGNINFAHDVEKGIRVKIVWPFYQNRTMIAHFDSTMNIVRDPGRPIAIPCKGTAYKRMEEGATYDIQFGDMDLLNLFSYMNPSNDKFSSVFAQHFEDLGIQRLVDIANNSVDINAKDVGIVFRQSIPYINTVTIDDAYGTLSFDDSPISLDLPGSPLKLPLNALPALHLKLGNIAQKGGQSIGVALTKDIGKLGFVALEGTFSRSTMRPVFTATLLCNPDLSLGGLVEQGLGLVNPNFLDSDFLKGIHLGSLSGKGVADGVMDALDHVTIPYVRIEVSKLASGSYGVSQLELELDINDVSFPEQDPVIQLSQFNIRVQQQRSDASLPQSSTPSQGVDTPSASGTVTSVYGSATVTLGGIDADCKFAYDPDSDAQLARMSIYPPPAPAGGRRLLLDVSFPKYHPTLGDLVDQIIGEAGKLVGGGTFKAQLPVAFHKVLDVAALQEIQVTLASPAQESASWSLVSFYVVVDLTGLVDLLEDIFDADLPFEWPKLAVRVNNPTIAEARTFDILLTSIVNISGSSATVVAELSRGTSTIYTGDVVMLSYQWDATTMPLTLSGVIDNLTNSLNDTTLGSAPGESYLTAVRKCVPDSLVTLVDDINIETIRIVAADFSVDKTKSNFGLAEIFVQIADTGDPWAPFGDAYPHLTFAGTRLGFDWKTGKPYATPADPSPKGSTDITFSTLMRMNSISLNIIFSWGKTSTTTTFNLSLANTTDEQFTLIDLITNIVNDLGFASMAFPEDARNLFDIDLASLTISYSKTVAPGTPSETISVTQAGGATFLGVTVSSIAIVADRTTGSWGYSLQVRLPPIVKPFAKVLPIPGVEDFTVVNGFFGIFKGPVVPPPQMAMAMPSTGTSDGLSIYLSGGLKFEGNDFLNLCGTILKIPQVDFAVQSGGTLSVAIPVGKLELTVADHKLFSVERFQLQISNGNFMLGADLTLMAEWLAPSIKESPIGFRFALGVGVSGSLNISIYAVDPTTGVLYPDMSKFPFIRGPFWIPGLVLYPFHFSMRWLAAANAPEAIAAGGGFYIENTPMTNVFALSLDRAKPTSNYVQCDIQELTISQIFGSLVPDHEDNKKIFDMFNMGFKVLKININPGNKQFKIYADFYLYFLHGKAAADVDPTAGLFAAIKVDPVNLGNGLVQLVSFDSGPTVGPYLRLCTNVRDLVAGRVPQNPQTPEWAGMTSGDARIDSSIFALTAKLVFLGFEFDIFGLIDQTGLLLFTYMGLNVELEGVKMKASRQMSVAITSEMFAGSLGFKFNLDIDIPPSVSAGIPLGQISKIKIADLDIGVALKIKYGEAGWLNDGLVFEASFYINILGLEIDERGMKLEITLKDLSEIPGAIANFIRDKVVDGFKDKILEPAKEAWEDAKEAISDAVDTMVGGFNLAEHEVGHAFAEFGQDASQLAMTLKNDLGMGLDEAVNVFKDLGKDISDFGEELADTFAVPLYTVAEAVVDEGLCSIEHAFGAGMKKASDELDELTNGAVGFANDLGNLGASAIEELEEAGKKVQKELDKVKDKIDEFADKAKGELQSFGKDFERGFDRLTEIARDAIGAIEDAAKDAGRHIEGAVTDIGRQIEDAAKDAGRAIEDAARNTGQKVEEAFQDVGRHIENGFTAVGNTIAEGAKNFGNEVASTFESVTSHCVVM